MTESQLNRLYVQKEAPWITSESLEGFLKGLQNPQPPKTLELRKGLSGVLERFGLGKG